MLGKSRFMFPRCAEEGHSEVSWERRAIAMIREGEREGGVAGSCPRDDLSSA